MVKKNIWGLEAIVLIFVNSKCTFHYIQLYCLVLHLLSGSYLVKDKFFTVKWNLSMYYSKGLCLDVENKLYLIFFTQHCTISWCTTQKCMLTLKYFNTSVYSINTNIKVQFFFHCARTKNRRTDLRRITQRGRQSHLLCLICFSALHTLMYLCVLENALRHLPMCNDSTLTFFTEWGLHIFKE